MSPSPSQHATSGLNLIEMHAHLIPDVDDGSRTPAESVTIAQQLVERGYSHLVCTPHVWPNLPHNHTREIARRVVELQTHLTSSGVPLTLLTGGEINLQPGLLRVHPDTLPTYGLRGTHFLVDAWVWNWESWLTPVIKHLQQGGRTVILAHPERLGLLQNEPSRIRKFQDLGVLFQGNLYCFADPKGERTRALADQYLDEGYYYMLAGDLHREDTLECRFKGLERVTSRLGLDGLTTYLRTHPGRLLGM